MGIQITAGTLQTSSGGTGVTRMDGIEAHASTGQAIPATTVTTLTYDVEDQDPYGNFASNAAVADSSGWYVIYGYCNLSMPYSGQTVSLDAYVNGAFGGRLFSDTASTNGQNMDPTGSLVVKLTAGDSVTLRLYHDSGGSITLYGSAPFQARFRMVFLHS